MLAAAVLEKTGGLPRKLLTRPKKLCAAEIGGTGPLFNREEANASRWLGCVSPSSRPHSLPMVGLDKDKKRGDKGHPLVPTGSIQSAGAAGAASRCLCCFFSCCLRQLIVYLGR